jgi:hypothetical protein
MKVPQAQTRETVNPSTIQTPRVPGAVPGAFGEGVAQATAGMGESLGRLGEIIGKRIEQRKLWDQAQQGSDALESYRSSLQNYLLGDETINVANGDGTTRELPSLLKRQGTNADGATVEYDQKASELSGRLKEQFAAFDPRISQHLQNELDNMTAGFRNKVISHEAAEWRRGKQASFEAAVTNEINQAMLADTPEALDQSMQAISAKSAILSTFLGEGKEEAKLTLNDAIDKGVLQATQASLRASGDIAKVQKLLDTLKDKPYMSPEIIAETKANLEKYGASVEAEAKRFATAQKISNRFDIIGKIATGQINPLEAGDAIRKVAQTDSDLAEAIIKAQDTKGDYIAEEVANDSFQDLAEKIFKSNDAETISGFLVGALKDENISRDRLTILVDAATSHAKELPTIGKQEKPAFWKAALQILKNSHVGTMFADTLIKVIERVKTEGASGTRVPEIAKEESEKYIKASNPQRTEYELNQVIANDATGKSYKVVGFYPDGEPEVDEIE